MISLKRKAPATHPCRKDQASAFKPDNTVFRDYSWYFKNLVLEDIEVLMYLQSNPETEQEDLHNYYPQEERAVTGPMGIGAGLFAIFALSS